MSSFWLYTFKIQFLVLVWLQKIIFASTKFRHAILHTCVEFMNSYGLYNIYRRTNIHTKYHFVNITYRWRRTYSIYIQIWNLFRKLPDVGPLSDRYWQIKIIKKHKSSRNSTSSNLPWHQIWFYFCLFKGMYVNIFYILENAVVINKHWESLNYQSFYLLLLLS